MNINYGVTPQGFRAKRLIDVKNDLEEYFIAEFGEINLDAQSVAGQIIGIYSKVLADIWENMEQVYISQYPNSAFGVSLDNVVQLNGLTRISAQPTRVIAVITGTPGTIVPRGSLARIPSTQEVFYSVENAVIESSNSAENIIRVNSLLGQEYTVIINGDLFTYSLPSIDFSAPLVSGNSISVRINGINIPSVSYATSSAATLTALKNQIISTLPNAVSSSSFVSGDSLKLIPNLGYKITVNSINVTGVGAPTGSVSFDTPSDLDTVAEYLSANIDQFSIFAKSEYNSGNEFTISSRSPSISYSLIVSTGLQITSTGTPVLFYSQNVGPIAAPAGSLTEILTPIPGWQSVNNIYAGTTGRYAETDEELRLRRMNSLRALGYATVEAIISRILQEVPSVTSVFVFENITMTQQDITVTFSSDFITDNEVFVFLDGLSIGSVSYISSNLQVMTDLAALISAQDPILSASVVGAGDHSLVIKMNETQEIEISFSIIDGVSQPTYTMSGGRPPKSFETLVQGGSDADVANKIWQVKPAGIQTFGNVSQSIVDSQGNTQVINFSRATPIYIWASVSLVLNPQEVFPPNGQQLVANAILAYGNSLGIGIDVFIQRVQAAVFSVPGIASANIQLAKTLNVSDVPSYSSSDIDIQESEISVWDLSRIIVSI